MGLHYEWPGNVRDLEQCVRSVILNGTCQPAIMASQKDGDWTHKILKGDFSANELLANYCRELYQQKKTYEQEAVITQLDRRTVNKYIDSHF